MPVKTDLEPPRIVEVVFRRDKYGFRIPDSQIGYVVQQLHHSKPRRVMKWMDVAPRSLLVEYYSVHGPLPPEGESPIPTLTDKQRTVVDKSRVVKLDNPHFLVRRRAEKVIQTLQAGFDRDAKKLEAQMARVERRRQRVPSRA